MPSKPSVREILVINVHSAENAGDAALLETAVIILRSAFPEVKIVLSMNQPNPVCYRERCEIIPSFTAHFTVYHPDRRIGWRIGALLRGVVISLLAALWHQIYKQPPRWIPDPWNELVSAYMNADLIVGCPGNIFATMGRVGLPLLVSAFSVFYSILLGKRLYIMPQSIGPLERGWERKLVRYLYSKARLVFVREPISFRLAENIGIAKEKLRLSPDLAFTLLQAPLEEIQNRLRTYNLDGHGPYVGVTVINRLIRHLSTDAWDRYESAVAYTLSRFIEEYGGQIVFFPQVTGPTTREDDRIAARRIVDQMKQPEHAIIINETLSPSMLKTMYGLMDIFVATRMHSAIFATSMGVPTLFLEYLHKVRGLAEMLNLEKWAIELKTVDDVSLWKALDDLWQERNAVRLHLSELVPDLVKQAESVGEIIAGDLCA